MGNLFNSVNSWEVSNEMFIRYLYSRVVLMFMNEEYVYEMIYFHIYLVIFGYYSFVNLFPFMCSILCISFAVFYC